jgi:hypothetical protein
MFSDQFPEAYEYYFKTITGKPLTSKPQTMIMEQNSYNRSIEHVMEMKTNVCLISASYPDRYFIEPRLKEASISSRLSEQTILRTEDLVLRCFHEE